MSFSTTLLRVATLSGSVEISATCSTREKSIVVQLIVCQIREGENVDHEPKGEIVKISILQNCLNQQERTKNSNETQKTLNDTSEAVNETFYKITLMGTLKITFMSPKIQLAQ